MTWEGLVQRNGKYCCIHCMEYSEFQTGIFGQWKVPINYQIHFVALFLEVTTLVWVFESTELIEGY